MNYQFKDVWTYYSIIRNFHNHSKEEQEETVAFFLQAKDNSRAHYWYVEGISQLIKLVPNKAIDLAKAAFSGKGTAYRYDGLGKLLIDIMPLDTKGEVKEIILNSEEHSVGKLALVYDNLTIDQEVKALKDLSQNKYCPVEIYNKRYTPRMEALEKLPPVGRLKTLEALLSNDHLSYNVFANVDDPDEFKRLIFGSVLRHRERGEVIWKKYQEAVNLGMPGTVTLKGNCENCGDFELTLKSSRTRTSVGFTRTYLSRYVHDHCCLLCGRRIENKMAVSASGEEMEGNVQ